MPLGLIAFGLGDTGGPRSAVARVADRSPKTATITAAAVTVLVPSLVIPPSTGLITAVGLLFLMAVAAGSARYPSPPAPLDGRNTT